MAQPDGSVTLDEVLKLARQLSPVDKARLIERVAPEVERELALKAGDESVSLLGLLRDLGPAPSADEIDATRREAWAAFPRFDP